VNLAPYFTAGYLYIVLTRGHPFMTSTRRGSGSGGRMWTGGGRVKPHVDIHTEITIKVH